MHSVGPVARPRVLRALVPACARQLLWTDRLVSREISSWQAIAETIPDRKLRRHALTSLYEKRNLALGAAFFSTLSHKRDAVLVRLLVAYQIMWDFLDSVSEDIAADGDAKGYRLHTALVEALTPDARISDYYGLHPATSDGGYLRALVEACQDGCSRLPSYAQVAPYVLAGVRHCSVQAINHDKMPHRRGTSLRQWAAREFPNERALSWFEVTAAASAFLPHPLIALASEASCTDQDAALACAAYYPLMSLAIVLLDSYVDRVVDLSRDDHSYVAYYDDLQTAVSRLAQLIEQMTDDLRRLRNGERHSIIAGCMIAMYLSNGAAHTSDVRPFTLKLVRDADDVTKLVLPLLRMRWRLGERVRFARVQDRSYMAAAR